MIFFAFAGSELIFFAFAGSELIFFEAGSILKLSFECGVGLDINSRGSFLKTDPARLVKRRLCDMHVEMGHLIELLRENDAAGFRAQCTLSQEEDSPVSALLSLFSLFSLPCSLISS